MVVGTGAVGFGAGPDVDTQGGVSGGECPLAEDEGGKQECDEGAEQTIHGRGATGAEGRNRGKRRRFERTRMKTISPVSHE